MSRKERDRLTIMIGIKTQGTDAGGGGELLGISYRQARRVWRRYQTQGDAGLVHRLRGRPSLRRLSPPCASGCWPAEYLAAEDGLQVDHETLRRWLLADGHRSVRRRRQVIVRTLRDGRVQLEYRGTKLRWRELPEHVPMPEVNGSLLPEARTSPAWPEIPRAGSGLPRG